MAATKIIYSSFSSRNSFLFRSSRYYATKIVFILTLAVNSNLSEFFSWTVAPQPIFEPFLLLLSTFLPDIWLIILDVHCGLDRAGSLGPTHIHPGC